MRLALSLAALSCLVPSVFAFSALAMAPKMINQQCSVDLLDAKKQKLGTLYVKINIPAAALRIPTPRPTTAVLEYASIRSVNRSVTQVVPVQYTPREFEDAYRSANLSFVSEDKFWKLTLSSKERLSVQRAILLDYGFSKKRFDWPGRILIDKYANITIVGIKCR